MVPLVFSSFAGVKGLDTDFKTLKTCIEKAENGYQCRGKMDDFEAMWAYVMKHYDKRCSDSESYSFSVDTTILYIRSHCYHICILFF